MLVMASLANMLFIQKDGEVVAPRMILHPTSYVGTHAQTGNRKFTQSEIYHAGQWLLYNP